MWSYSKHDILSDLSSLMPVWTIQEKYFVSFLVEARSRVITGASEVTWCRLWMNCSHIDDEMN